jgi:hypothetical protein
VTEVVLVLVVIRCKEDDSRWWAEGYDQGATRKSQVSSIAASLQTHARCLLVTEVRKVEMSARSFFIFSRRARTSPLINLAVDLYTDCSGFGCDTQILSYLDADRGARDHRGGTSISGFVDTTHRAQWAIFPAYLLWVCNIYKRGKDSGGMPTQV